MGTDTFIGDNIYNHKDKELGDIKEIMLDVNNGRIAYAVLSVGGFLGIIANKLFTVPWRALKLDTANKALSAQCGQTTPGIRSGFDKDD